MVETVIILLVIMWALGLGFHIAGSLIHLLLVIALVAFLFRVFRRRTP